VLCVEDNDVNAVLMEAIIGMREAVTLLTVPDGSQALAALARFKPDLLLLDMHLPDTTGTKLLAEIRRQHPECVAPAVMVSAAARAEDIQRALDAGFAGYWTKPLDIDRTLVELDRLLGG
jgi:CheY-like chemotaxis protein